MYSEGKLKKQIIKSASSVKNKVRRLRDMQTENDKVLKSVFKPLTDPLHKMVSFNNKEDIISEKKTRYMKKELEMKTESDVSEYETDSEENNEIVNKTLQNIDDYIDEDDSESMSDTNNKDINVSSDTSFKTLDSFSSPQKHIESHGSISPQTRLRLPSLQVLQDVPFGVRTERGKLMMGSSRIIQTEKSISVSGKTYKKTEGLMELLFKKIPDMKAITNSDLTNYKQILMLTNAHRRDFNPKKPIKSNKGSKYLNVIKPLFKLSKECTSTESLHQGSGLPTLKKYNKNVDYVYWDDPNELVERLKLLNASRDAGNSGLDNEIISIVEELREAGIINT